MFLIIFLILACHKKNHLILNHHQVANSTRFDQIYILNNPEEVVDWINLDCNNEDDPSDMSCIGKWFYWHKEEGNGGQWTTQGGDWRVDASIRFVCRGNIFQDREYNNRIF